MQTREIALLTLTLTACANAPESTVDFVRLDASNTTPATCSEVNTPMTGATLAQLAAVSSDRIIAVFPEERQVALLDDSLHVVWTRTFDSVGPRGVAEPIGSALLDSVLFVIDQQRPVLRRFDPDGEPLATINLNFVPAAIAVAAGKLLVIPAVIGRFPTSLLYILEGDSLRAARITPANFDNVSVKMLGNLLAIAPSSRGAVLIHQFLTPRAYEWAPNEPIRTLALPLPAAARRSVGYVPPVPLDSAALHPALVAAIAAARDDRQNGYVILTRSGKKLRTASEKVLLLTDSMLQFRAARSLPVNAGHLAMLSRRNAAVVVDEEGRWHTCSMN